MLNILVCVKQVPDVNLVKIDPETGSLIRKGVPAILNPHDENALEAALRMKERYGGSVTCITMGPDQAEEALRECLAAGADRAVLLSDRAFANADTLATSYVIVSAARTLGSFDLVFCGKESLDGATGQMASQLAERLDCSQLSCVEEILDLDERAGTLTARRCLERGFETARKASRKAEILRFDSRSIPGLDPAQIGDPGSPTKVPRTYPPAVGQRGRMLDEGSTEKTVEKLLGLLAGER